MRVEVTTLCFASKPYDKHDADGQQGACEPERDECLPPVRAVAHRLDDPDADGPRVERANERGDASEAERAESRRPGDGAPKRAATSRFRAHGSMMQVAARPVNARSPATSPPAPPAAADPPRSRAASDEHRSKGQVLLAVDQGSSANVRVFGFPQSSPIRSARSKSGASERGAARRGERDRGRPGAHGAVAPSAQGSRYGTLSTTGRLPPSPSARTPSPRLTKAELRRTFVRHLIIRQVSVWKPNRSLGRSS